MRNFWKEAVALFTISIVKEVPIYRDSRLDTKTVLNLEFRNWDLFRIWCLKFRILKQVV